MKCRISGKETVEVFNLGNLQMSDFIEPDEQPRTGTVFCRLKSQFLKTKCMENIGIARVSIRQ